MNLKVQAHIALPVATPKLLERRRTLNAALANPDLKVWGIGPRKALAVATGLTTNQVVVALRDPLLKAGLKRKFENEAREAIMQIAKNNGYIRSLHELSRRTGIKRPSLKRYLDNWSLWQLFPGISEDIETQARLGRERASATRRRTSKRRVLRAFEKNPARQSELRKLARISKFGLRYLQRRDPEIDFVVLATKGKNSTLTPKELESLKKGRLPYLKRRYPIAKRNAAKQRREKALANAAK